MISTISKKTGRPWYDVLKRAETSWNSKYISPLGIGPPSSIDENNFDLVVEALYTKNPIYMQSLYGLGRVMNESDAKNIFDFSIGDRVLVSLRKVGKRVLKNPVR